MGAEHLVARATLEAARLMFTDNVEGITLDEALDTGGRLRSIIGLVKHTAGWAAVYRSFAFDDAPRSWNETDWPRGLRERIEPSAAYLGELLAWFDPDVERMARCDQRRRRSRRNAASPLGRDVAASGHRRVCRRALGISLTRSHRSHTLRVLRGRGLPPAR